MAFMTDCQVLPFGAMLTSFLTVHATQIVGEGEVVSTKGNSWLPFSHLHSMRDRHN